MLASYFIVKCLEEQAQRFHRALVNYVHLYRIILVGLITCNLCDCSETWSEGVSCKVFWNYTSV